MASDGYTNLLNTITTYNLNGIASTTTSVLNVRILYLFEASLNAFKTQKYSIVFLIRISRILIKLAAKWALLQL